MKPETANAPVVLDELEALRHDRERLQAEVADLRQQVRFLREALYGRRSERRPGPDDSAQSRFDFGDFEPTIERAKPRPTTAVATHERRKPGRRPLSPDLPRVEVRHELPESERVCGCGCVMQPIGEETAERLDIVPAKVQVIRNLYIKYACKNRQCDGGSGSVPAMKQTPAPPELIPQGIVTIALLAHIIVSKFVDGLPLYRQAAQLARYGADIPRTTLSEWVMQVGFACEVFEDLMLEEIRNGPIASSDETPLVILDEAGRRRHRVRAQIWVARGGNPSRPVVLFQYDPTRSKDVPLRIFAGFRGYLQTDGYIGYNALSRQSCIIQVGCLAHVRRKFVDVVKCRPADAEPGHADRIIDWIRDIYAIDAQIRASALSDEQIVQQRTERVLPELQGLEQSIERLEGRTPPKGPLGRAVTYALGQLPRIRRYVEHAWLRLDNNLIEGAIRGLAIGRKNWLFAGSPRGARAMALFFSLIESARANQLDPQAYLTHVFRQLPRALTHDAIVALLPSRIDPAVLKGRC